MIGITWGKCSPKNPPNRGVNMHFRAKLPKSIRPNCDISEIIHPISPKFDDETHTVNARRVWSITAVHEVLHG